MGHWSETYLSWSGDFESLVKTANVVLKGLTPPMDEVTESLVRHYQSKNLVGRGVKRGRQAYFNVSDLQAVVETKRLAQDGWGLDKVAQIYQTTTNTTEDRIGSTHAMEVVQGLMKKSAQAPLSTPSLSASVSGSLSTANAQSVKLRSSHSFPSSQSQLFQNPVKQNLNQEDFCSQDSIQSHLHQVELNKTSSPLYATPSPGFAQESAKLMDTHFLDNLDSSSSFYSASQSTSKMRHELQPAPWLTAYIDPRQLEFASLEDIQKACDALKDWCQTQKWVSSTRTS